MFAIASAAESFRRTRTGSRRFTALALAPLALVALAPVAGASASAADATGAGATVHAYGSSSSTAATDGQSPAAALRGSIVYVKNNNIWLTRGDGTGTKQVTRDGSATSPYRVPSQSDAGIIAAARGDLIVRMDRTGKILNTINPPPLMNSVQHELDGAPTEVAISPNGNCDAGSPQPRLIVPGGHHPDWSAAAL